MAERRHAEIRGQILHNQDGGGNIGTEDRFDHAHRIHPGRSRPQPSWAMKSQAAGSAKVLTSYKGTHQRHSGPSNLAHCREEEVGTTRWTPASREARSTRTAPSRAGHDQFVLMLGKFLRKSEAT